MNYPAILPGAMPEKPEDCPICYESLKDQKTSTICQHWFHDKCLLNQVRCPLCRCDLIDGQPQAIDLTSGRIVVVPRVIVTSPDEYEVNPEDDAEIERQLDMYIRKPSFARASASTQARIVASIRGHFECDNIVDDESDPESENEEMTDIDYPDDESDGGYGCEQY